MFKLIEDYQNVPKWLRPFLRTGAYSPDLQFLQDLVPQSRIEAILKFGFLGLLSKYGGFLVMSENVTGEYLNFIDSTGRVFRTPA